MAEVVSNCSTLDDGPDSPRLLLDNALFLISAGLSVLVAAATVKDPNDSIPVASGYVLMLCGCEVLLAALSLTQLAVSRADCELADAIYGLVCSLEMAAQLLALVSAAIIGMLIIEPFWPACCATIKAPLRPRTQKLALALLCSVPALFNVGICYGHPFSTAATASCPTKCGYALDQASASHVLQSGNQCAGALLVLGTTLAAALATRCNGARLTTRAVRSRHVHRMLRYGFGVVVLWGCVSIARFTPGHGPGCVWDWVLALQGLQGALNALLLAPQAVPVPPPRSEESSPSSTHSPGPTHGAPVGPRARASAREPFLPCWPGAAPASRGRRALSTQRGPHGSLTWHAHCPCSRPCSRPLLPPAHPGAALLRPAAAALRRLRAQRRADAARAHLEPRARALAPRVAQPRRARRTGGAAARHRPGRGRAGVVGWCAWRRWRALDASRRAAGPGGARTGRCGVCVRVARFPVFS